MSNAFGSPTIDDQSNPDDQFAGMGIPTDIGVANPIGVFDMTCVGAKPINAQSGARYMALEFKCTDPDFAGEEYAIMAEAFDPSDGRDVIRKKTRGWARLGSACSAMGLAVNGATQTPLEGWGACAGLACRAALSTYAKDGQDVPTIVWGRPKSRQSSGVEVGFPRDLADDQGKYRDYGCGILPPE